MDRQQRRMLLALGGLVGLVLLVLVVTMLTGAGGGDDETVAVGRSSSTSAPATLLPSTVTTLPPTTTTARRASITSAAPTTAAPTTTAPGGGVVLDPDGLGVVRFGTDAETAVARLTAALGPPAEDSGYVHSSRQFGACPGNEVRGLRWGSLTVLVTNGETAFGAKGQRHLFAYYDAPWDFAGSPVESSGLETRRGIGIGFTVAELKAAYGGGVVVQEDESGAHFEVAVPAPGSLSGSLSGTGDDATIETIAGGPGCGE